MNAVTPPQFVILDYAYATDFLVERETCRHIPLPKGRGKKGGSLLIIRPHSLFIWGRGSAVHCSSYSHLSSPRWCFCHFAKGGGGGAARGENILQQSSFRVFSPFIFFYVPALFFAGKRYFSWERGRLAAYLVFQLEKAARKNGSGKARFSLHSLPVVVKEDPFVGLSLVPPPPEWGCKKATVGDRGFPSSFHRDFYGTMKR